jgi:DNA-binding NtrC family response regulator
MGVELNLGVVAIMTRVLVVDDEATVLKNIGRSLRRSGFEVVTAMNCQDAKSAFEQYKFDALCLDIVLPDGDGLVLLEEVRQFAPSLPTIVISSAVTAENKRRADRLGVLSFLPKPFRLAELKEALVKFIVET